MLLRANLKVGQECIPSNGDAMIGHQIRERKYFPGCYTNLHWWLDQFNYYAIVSVILERKVEYVVWY